MKSLTFSAIDFETAHKHHICSVGIVHVENGEIVDEFHTLIKPPQNYFNPYTIKVHGITPADTYHAPYFDEIYPDIRQHLYERILVAHNESFDRNVLMKSMQDYGLNYSDLRIANRWECTLQIYRKLGYKPARLNACCEKHNIPLQHHDALSDARACAQLYLIANQ